MDKKGLKEDCIKLFLEGKTYSEIAKLTGWSRTFITNLIKDDQRIIEKNKIKKIKVHKRKNGQMIIYIPTKSLEKLGISKDLNKIEYVNVKLDDSSKNIIIEKHS